MRHSRVADAVLACTLVLCASALGAQTALPAPSALSGASLPAITVEPSDQSATLMFFNRPIAVLRARVMGRGPAERVATASRALDDLVGQHITGPVQWEAFDGGALISVAGRGVVALTTSDVDVLSGERVEGVAARTVDRLQQALNEAIEARTPGVLLRSSAYAAGALVLAVLAIWGVARAHRAAADALVAAAEKTVARSGIADIDSLRASHLLDVQRWVLTTLAGALDILVIYATLGFALRRFPYTRAWGESMRGFLVTTVENVALGIARAVPGLLTVLIVFVITRFLARVIRMWFDAVERGRLTPRWIYPETAQPTRRLVTGLLWVFSIAVTYPYLPGSQTDAFKGASVFLGLMLTLGSSGLVNQVMSSFMITYSRALRVGDYVRIGDVEGTVIHLGVLSTKVRTFRHEEVTIPNAVVVSQTTTDYSRTNDFGGVFTATSVTIGYDTPWRQVQALLLMAAERTAGIRRDPKPLVIQAALEDFYVKYTLWVCLERQDSRPVTLDALHAHIQDLFNEYGVQIMSPNYVVDPASPKIVAKKDWFASPAPDTVSVTSRNRTFKG